MTLAEAREIVAASAVASTLEGSFELMQLAEARAMVAGAEQAGVEEYDRGFRDGVAAYAYTSSEPWAESGVHYVGTTGTRLRDALERVEDTYNYSPGQTSIR